MNRADRSEGLRRFESGKAGRRLIATDVCVSNRSIFGATFGLGMIHSPVVLIGKQNRELPLKARSSLLRKPTRGNVFRQWTLSAFSFWRRITDATLML